MTGTCWIVTPTFVISLALSLLANAQDSRKGPQINLRVEVKPSKRVYVAGEPVRFTAILRNSGNNELYISKSFSQASAGTAGFYVSIKQVTGRPSATTCGTTVDVGPSSDSRTPDQILREDYLVLSPGAMVGFESQYDGCNVENPGAYQITATYSAQDLNVGKVKQVAGKADQIVTGQFESAARAFRVH